MKKYTKEDHKLLAIWGANCAEKFLPYFENINPKDNRPRKAIERCRKWVQDRVFKMSEVREDSLAAHAAAREIKGKNEIAGFAARAAGQAAAIPHVPQHAFGPIYYALKIILKTNSPENAKEKIAEEIEVQTKLLAEHLRKDFKEFQEKKFPKYLKKIID